MAKKIKITVVENGFDKEIEIEVPDEAGSWQKPRRCASCTSARHASTALAK
jgi:hypothetical protein